MFFLFWAQFPLTPMICGSGTPAFIYVRMPQRCSSDSRSVMASGNVTWVRVFKSLTEAGMAMKNSRNF